MYNVESYNPDELTAKVKQEQEETSNLAVSTLQWFLNDNRIGELYPRGDVVQALSEHLEVDNRKASAALSSVVGDIVDPVQQVVTKEGKFVGIIDYNVYDDSGAYGYIHFDDRQLQRKRVVCAKCVEEADLDGEVVHATQGEGSSNEDASWKQLLNKVTSHYADAHSEAPEEIEPGATLLSGTTISGNTAYHTGSSSISSDTLKASDSITLPAYSTLGDVPTTLDEGTLVWVADENKIYKETGT